MAMIAHISDLHFGAASETALGALIGDLNDRRPGIVVVTGDLTQSGRRCEFEAASDFLAAITADILVIPGNHDVPVVNLWQRFMSPYGRFQRYINVESDPVLGTGDITIIGLNSARRAALDLNWSYGRFSRERSLVCGE